MSLGRVRTEAAEGKRGGGGGKAKEMGVIARSLVPRMASPPRMVPSARICACFFSETESECTFVERGKDLDFRGFPPFSGCRLLWGFEVEIQRFLEGERGVLKPCQDRDMTRPESLSHLVGGAEKDGCGGFSRRV